MSLRVLILSWEYPPIVEGGLARHVRKLAEGLVRNGVEVHVLARGGGRLQPVEDRHGVTVHRVREPEFPKDDLDAFVAWVDAMNDDMRVAGAALGDSISFDLVHSHDWLVAGAARKLARRFKCPWLVTVHATEHGRHQGWVKKHPQKHIHGVERRMVRAADQVITCSHYMRGHVAEVFGIDGRRSPWCRTASTPRTSSRPRTCPVCAPATRSRTSSWCSWWGGSSTRRASTSPWMPCRA